MSRLSEARVCRCTGTAFLAASFVAGAAAAPCRPVLEWDRWLSVPGRDSRLAGMRANADGGVSLGAWERAIDAPDLSAFSAGFWQLSADGKERYRGRVNSLQNLSPSGFETMQVTAVDDVLTTRSGRLFASVELDAAVPGLIELGPANTTALEARLAIEARSLVARLVELGSGEILGLGRVERSALALVLDETGQIRRRIADSFGATARYVDAVEQADGHLVVVANGGSYDMLLQGPSRIVLRRIGPDFAKVKELTFPGRYGSLALLKGGNLALVYDQADSTQQNIILQMYDPSLNLLWEKPVVAFDQGFSHFRGMALHGGVAVAGAKLGKPYLAFFSGQGEKQWEVWREEDRYGGEEVGLSVRGPEVYFGTSNYVELGPQNYLQQIRVFKYICDANEAAVAVTPRSAP